MIHDTNQESWKPIIHPNYILPGYYISSQGRVYNALRNNFVKPYMNKNGYLAVKLPTNKLMDNGKYKFVNVNIHILVHYQFTTEPEKIYDEHFIVNHKDGIKENCVYTNLEWVTYKGNADHAVQHGLIKSCEDSPESKIDNETVHKICKMFEENKTYAEIRESLNLPNNKYILSLFVRIRTGKQWKMISDQYKFDKSSKLRHYDNEYIDEVCKLIENGDTVSQMYRSVGSEKMTYPQFKKLVWFIRNRKSYKDISDKYTWWR